MRQTRKSPDRQSLTGWFGDELKRAAGSASRTISCRISVGMPVKVAFGMVVAEIGRVRDTAGCCCELVGPDVNVKCTHKICGGEGSG